jgi:ADP-ribose pyrophosphatase
MLSPLTPSDLPWATQFLQAHGSLSVVSRGRLSDPSEYPGFVLCNEQGTPQALATYRIENGECELLSLAPLPAGGEFSLVETVRRAALERGCWRLWLVVSNDNTPALRYYQQAGFRLSAVHRGALEHARTLKPSLPLTGVDGLPVHDEVELEIILRELPPPNQPPAFPLRLSRRTVYESEWVGLYLDRVVFPDGRLIPEYHLLHTRNAVAVLVENESSELLFEHVYRYATNRMEWEIPAGGVEDGEDILDSARREVQEETGFETHAHHLIYTFNPANGSIDTRFFIVACQVGERTAGIDPGEIQSTRWLKRVEIEELILRGELQDGFTLTAVLLWWWLKQPRSRSRD